MANQDTSNLTHAHKRMSHETIKRRQKLIPLAIALLAGTMLVQHALDPQIQDIHRFEKNVGTSAAGLNNEFMLLPLLGFREAAAGLLWVRCDEFFHSGDYDAILPLVRMVTWLDPHADNVYVTGAWHLSYNFTDSSERSDWRYIAPSQALLDEGIKNNFNIADIKFEKGWQNFDKIKDYPAAAEAFKLAIAGPKGDGKGLPGTEEYPYAAPVKTWHILGHTYERMGRIPEALDIWKKAWDRTEKDIAAQKAAGKKEVDYSLKQMLATEIHNYNQNIQRWNDRYTYANHDPSVNPTKFPYVIAPPVKDPNQTPRPWDLALKTQIDVVRPHVLKISGAFSSANGARINVWISDWNYKAKGLGETLNSFEVEQDTTILHDAISVREQKFSREMDMSKDPKMYSFVSDTYKIVLDYNVRQSSPFLQDRFGWSGEGITDGNPSHVVVDKTPGAMGTTLIEGVGGEGPVWDGKTAPWGKFGQPLRLTRVTYKVSRDQMEGKKPITDKDIVPNE